MNTGDRKEPSDDRLREAFTELGRERSGSLEAIEPELVWSAVRAEASPQQVSALSEQMAMDPALAEEWRLAMAFSAEADAAAEGEDSSSEAVPDAEQRETQTPDSRRGAVVHLFPVLALVAAALLLVLALPREVAAPYVDDPATVRGDSATITAVHGEGPVSRDALDLEWSPVEGALRYELFVRTSDLEVVLDTRTLDTPRYTVPPQRVANLPADAPLLWRVIAVLRDGSQVPSKTFIATVR